MTMDYIPSPGAVIIVQIVFSVVAVVGIRLAGYPVDWFEPSKLSAYAPYVAIFVLAIYTNMKALQFSNVETVIVFRACTPIAVSAIEYKYLDRELPSTRSMISMGVLVIGATIYCYSEAGVSLHAAEAYIWTVLYFVLISLEMTYGKMLISSVKMDSIWGPVLYCNALSVGPMVVLASASEPSFFTALLSLGDLSIGGYGVLLFSCAAGLAIGYTSWDCRSMVSAAAFTVIGVVNKFLTIVLNVLVWSKHSTPLGLTAVCVCLIAGCFYQQAPKRAAAEIVEARRRQAEEDEEMELLRAVGGQTQEDAAEHSR
eukprot:gene27579-33311_t